MTLPDVTLDSSVWVAALDVADYFHRQSSNLLEVLAQQGAHLHGPSFVLVEAACAMGRKAGDSAVAEEAHLRLRSFPALVLHPVDTQCLQTAYQLGARHFLRGADALYVATAALYDAPLVTWDRELVERAGAFTPDTLPAN